MGIQKLIVDIDSKLKDDFRIHAMKKGLTMKQLIETMIKKELKVK